MEKNSDDSTSSCFKLLQPELMTVEELCEILRACCVKNDLTSYTKVELVELFKRVALPLPQRDYCGNSWRERLLFKNQKRQASTTERDVKRLCASNGSTKNITLATTINDNKTSFKTSPPGIIPSNRLKPPITLNNYTKKVLKLALPDSKSTDNPCSSRKIVINEKNEVKPQEKNTVPISKKIVINEQKDEASLIKKKSVTSANSEKQSLSNGKHKRIVIDFSDSSTSTTKTPKVVNLKRSTSNNEGSSTEKKTRKIINI